MKKLFVTTLAIIILLLILIDVSIAKSNDIPLYTELNPSGSPSSFMLSVPQRPNAAGFCYLESLSMQIAYYRPDISAGKVFAYGMFGAGVFWSDKYPPNTLLINKMFTTGHTLSVIEGFGISYVLGTGSEQGYSDMYEYASGKLFFENGQQALSYLKAAIADGRPVQVHLDIGYLEVDGVSCHPKFNPVVPGSSHFMLVVGYDENNVYFNETIFEEMDPEDNEFREFPVPNSTFLEAWRMAGEINKGTALQGGPYWMMFFTHKDGSEIVETKTTEEIIADHKADAIKNSDVILSHIDFLHKSNEQDWEYQKISIIHSLFANFLSELRMTAASVAYSDLADWYDTLRDHGLSYQKTILRNTIAPLEDLAVEKLGKVNEDKDEDDDGDGFTENQGDCDDNDNTIYPGAIEICDDGIDQNCDGHDETSLEAPIAPRGLAANAVSYRKIMLRWTDQSTDEDGFKIERKKRGCNSTYEWSQIATVLENVNTYNDVGFEPDTQYSYRIRAYSGLSNSGYSNCGTTVAGISGTPSAPVNLVATYVSSAEVDLTWDEWSTNVTEFNIYREENNSDSWTLLATTGPTTFNYRDIEAFDNQSTTGYCYYVQACNDKGCSPPTYTVCMPFNPTSLTAANISNGKIILEWEDNSDNERGFEIYRKTGNCLSSASWEKDKSCGIDRTTVTAKKDYTSGTTYSYKIRAYCRSWGLPYVYGYSNWSNCVSITTP